MLLEGTQKRKCEEILIWHGRESQERQAMEEMAELTQALNKLWRNRRGHIRKDRTKLLNNVTEEMADVIICLEQLIQIYSNEKEIKEVIDCKLEKTLTEMFLSVSALQNDNEA